jgi:hypothetical protein
MFMSDPTEEPVDLVDIEEYARANKPKPPARRYRLRVDRERYETTNPKPTGREILALAGKTAETHLLSQKTARGAPLTIEPDQPVDLRDPGVERFMTVPREATEGRHLRRQFQLPPDDLEFVEGRGEPWETISEQGVQWLLLHRFALPAGYNVSHATAAIRVLPGYPQTPLDMIYLEPAVARADGKPINALSALTIDGRAFQQWSRHRPADAWRVGEDCIATHCAYAFGWLSDELRKR